MTLSAKISRETVAFIHGYRPCQSRPRHFQKRLQVMKALEDIRNVHHMQKRDLAPFWLHEPVIALEGGGIKPRSKGLFSIPLSDVSIDIASRGGAAPCPTKLLA